MLCSQQHEVVSKNSLINETSVWKEEATFNLLQHFMMAMQTLMWVEVAGCLLRACLKRPTMLFWFGIVAVALSHDNSGTGDLTRVLLLVVVASAFINPAGTTSAGF